MTIDDPNDPLTSTLRPLSDSIITVRIIKSFPYRSVKNLVLPHVNLESTTVGGLKQMVKDEIMKTPAYKPFRTVVNDLDTIKLYTKAHGFKTTDLVINLDHDDWILTNEETTLASAGIENETELSFFNLMAYKGFQKNPEVAW